MVSVRRHELIGKENSPMKTIKDTLRFDSAGLTAPEVGEFIKKEIGSLRCPEHDLGVDYEPGNGADNQATQALSGQFSLPVEYCCPKLRDLARGISPKRR